MITTNTYRVIFKSQISCQGFCMHVYQHGNLFSRIIIIPTLQIKKLSGKKKKKTEWEMPALPLFIITLYHLLNMNSEIFFPVLSNISFIL